MILPTKHIRPERAILSTGLEVLVCLRAPMTISRLWDDLRNRQTEMQGTTAINYDWFILTLDFLYLIKAIDLRKGLIRKTSI